MIVYGEKRRGHPSLQNDVKIMEKEQHWTIRQLEESSHMLGSSKNLKVVNIISRAIVLVRMEWYK